MYIQSNNISFSSKWHLFNVFKSQRVNVVPDVQADTFIRTTQPFAVDFKSIIRDKFINSGREASVYRTNYEDYALRINHKCEYKPEEMIPVFDGNGLILASNPKNTVQIQKYHKGEPLYGEDWYIVGANISKDEYLETFNKIKELPDESISEYIKTIVNVRKCGYDTDPLNPNNIVFDGTNLNIVDIAKRKGIEPDIYITDFYPLLDFFHIREFLSAMNRAEFCKFTDEVEKFFDKIISVSGNMGYMLQKESIEYPGEFVHTHIKSANL